MPMYMHALKMGASWRQLLHTSIQMCAFVLILLSKQPPLSGLRHSIMHHAESAGVAKVSPSQDPPQDLLLYMVQSGIMQNSIIESWFQANCDGAVAKT